MKNGIGHTTKEVVAESIRKYRTDAGLTQADLGRKIGKSESFIRDAEKGRNEVTIGTLEKIANAVGVPMLKMLDKSYGEEKSVFDKFIKLLIYNLDERLTVSGILIKNGYTVGQMKQKRTETGKVLDYFLTARLDDENADTAR